MDIHRIKYNNLKYITHSRVHYLWAINELNEWKGFARATDVASLLGVTRSAVSIALAQLKSLQLVEEIRPERFLQLTPQGNKKLNDIDSNFITLSRFFQSFLKLDEETATKQACLIEHLLLEEVAEKMNQLIDTKFKGEKTTVLRDRFHD
ncbi:MAG TPA: metal-dependent transcriptional regulator [Candidatus Hydrogenedens sp.]|nr:metal-dependent transcriptional regulator [Candidatus Hydrogenedens sp.]